MSRLADRYAGVEYESVLGLIIQNAELVQPSDLPDPVSTDPGDDKFLASALAGDSTIIVSGDSDFINVSGYCGRKVLTPKAFVSERLDQSGWNLFQNSLGIISTTHHTGSASKYVVQSDTL